MLAHLVADDRHELHTMYRRLELAVLREELLLKLEFRFPESFPEAVNVCNRFGKVKVFCLLSQSRPNHIFTSLA
jgi:hypothetical protein